MVGNRSLLPEGLLSRQERAQAQVLIHVAEAPGSTSKDLRAILGDTPDISKALGSAFESKLVKRDGDGTRYNTYKYSIQPEGLKLLAGLKEKIEEDVAAQAQLENIIPKELQM